MSATPSEGLTSAEAAERRRALGEPQADRTSIPLRAIIRRNVFTLINLITLGFLVLILISGAWKDALFAVVIVINSCIGIVQEVRAKRMLDRPALLIAPRATVRRDHTTIEILADEVVPDDIVELQPGDQVVADEVRDHDRQLRRARSGELRAGIPRRATAGGQVDRPGSGGTCGLR